jgi:hypothetical protein
LSFFSDERRDLALAHYNAMVQQERLDAGAEFFQNGEAIAVNHLSLEEVNDQHQPRNEGVWSMEEKRKFIF